MKPAPNINDDASMIRIGRLSALGSARKEAAEALRDAVVAVQSSSWFDLRAAVDATTEPAERLRTLAAMWSEL